MQNCCIVLEIKRQDCSIVPDINMKYCSTGCPKKNDTKNLVSFQKPSDTKWHEIIKTKCLTIWGVDFNKLKATRIPLKKTRAKRECRPSVHGNLFQVGVVSSEVLVNTYPDLIDTYSFYTGMLASGTQYIHFVLQGRMEGPCTAVHQRGTTCTIMTGALTRDLTG